MALHFVCGFLAHHNGILLLTFRPILRKIKTSEEKNIVLDCEADKLPDILLQAMQVGLMGTDYNYIITNLVSHHTVLAL